MKEYGKKTIEDIEFRLVRGTVKELKMIIPGPIQYCIQAKAKNENKFSNFCHAVRKNMIEKRWNDNDWLIKNFKE